MLNDDHTVLLFGYESDNILSQCRALRAGGVTLKIQEIKDDLLTSHYFQKLPGDVFWLRPHLKLTTGGLKPLLDVINGDAN